MGSDRPFRALAERPARPLSGWRVLLESVFWFGLPGFLILACVYWLVPFLVDGGMPLLHAWTLSVVGPTALNAFLVAACYLHSESPDWSGFVRRFRLQRPSLRLVLLVPVIAVVILALNESLSWTIPLIRDLPGVIPPPIQPALFEDPYTVLGGSGPAEFMGVQLDGSTWWVLPYWIILWVTIAVFCEEFVWRGYLLPKQEAVWGRWAWLCNGLFWNVPFHLYTLTAVLADMPFFLLLPLATQRVGNTWFAIMVHSLLASLALIVILDGLF
jgi:membrane protease YdiL (CAAX protease family)